jgi:hypothetical protein
MIAALLLLFSAPSADAASFGLKDLLTILDRDQIGTIDALVPSLPESHRRSFVLMRESRSRQGSSAENPRAILFGDDGRFVLAFNGDPSHAGYDSLEMYEVNPETFEFEFYAIEFPPRRGADGKVIPPVKNPHTCMHCHGPSPKPRWSSYPVWPGAYAFRADLMRPDEKPLYERYLAGRAAHPRYSKLLHFSSAPNAPYRSGNMEKNHEVRPNGRFGSLANRWNNRRLEKKVKASEAYARYLPLLMYTLNGCKPLDRPIPEWNWTAAEVAKLKLEFPELDQASIISRFGVSVSDFDMTTLDETPVGMSYGDGTLLGDARTFLMGALVSDFLVTRPQMSDLVLTYPDSAYGEGIVIRTDFDRQHSRVLDSIAVAARFRLRTCPLLLEEVRGLRR